MIYYLFDSNGKYLGLTALHLPDFHLFIPSEVSSFIITQWSGTWRRRMLRGFQVVVSNFPSAYWGTIFPPFSGLGSAWLTLWPWRCRQYVSMKHQWISARVHNIASQKIIFFKLLFCKLSLNLSLKVLVTVYGEIYKESNLGREHTRPFIFKICDAVNIMAKICHGYWGTSHLFGASQYFRHMEICFIQRVSLI